MATAPVLEEKTAKFRKVTEAELKEALTYIATDRPAQHYVRGPKRGQVKKPAYVGIELSLELLRIIGNSALERWKEDPRAKLPMIAAGAARQAVPQYRTSNAVETQRLYEGYKCATMKIMNIRALWQQRQDRAAEAEGVTVQPKPKQTVYPLDERPRFAKQHRLIS